MLIEHFMAQMKYLWAEFGHLAEWSRTPCYLMLITTPCGWRCVFHLTVIGSM